MSLFVYYILFATIMLIALISTILVGISKKNKEGDPTYDSKTKGNWSRLSWIYIIVIALGYVALVVYLTKFHS
jgi:heme/copper-type cytochrome/quinol oxidase subunit 2